MPSAAVVNSVIAPPVSAQKPHDRPTLGDALPLWSLRCASREGRSERDGDIAGRRTNKE